jgi:hypothetical protein
LAGWERVADGFETGARAYCASGRGLISLRLEFSMSVPITRIASSAGLAEIRLDHPDAQSV